MISDILSSKQRSVLEASLAIYYIVKYGRKLWSYFMSTAEKPLFSESQKMCLYD